jgi:prepilin-type N-terminal cleavage/methylation domain-containing protein
MARRRSPAFSLLEVMVALAILAVGLVLLLQVQARSAELAIEAREMTVATMLARGKLYDCQTDLLKKGFSVGDYDADGAFDDEGYPDYFWECHGYKPDMPTADSGDFSGDFNGAAGQLGLGAASDAASASGQNPAQEMGMQFLAPVLSQMSSVLGDSIRELVVIVRWGQGDARREMTVTTHVIDKGPVNQVSAMIQQQTRALGGTSVGGGGANDRRPAADQPAASAPGLPGSPTTPGAPPPPPWGPKG